MFNPGNSSRNDLRTSANVGTISPCHCAKYRFPQLVHSFIWFDILSHRNKGSHFVTQAELWTCPLLASVSRYRDHRLVPAHPDQRFPYIIWALNSWKGQVLSADAFIPPHSSGKWRPRELMAFPLAGVEGEPSAWRLQDPLQPRLLSLIKHSLLVV